VTSGQRPATSREELVRGKRALIPPTCEAMTPPGFRLAGEIRCEVENAKAAARLPHSKEKRGCGGGTHVR
jgi:hypothetical protein